jgi:hypothetical protein
VELAVSVDLPRFTDRLPDLIQALQITGEALASAQPKQSYLPYWEDLFQTTHSLKGVLGILSCPPTLARFITALDQTFVMGVSGPLVCRRIQEAGAMMSELAHLLYTTEPDLLDGKPLSAWIERFLDLHAQDLDHEARLKEIPSHLFYVNEFVSKKAREIVLLNLNHCVVEDQVLLEEIPLWRAQLQEALLGPEFGRGLLVNFLPFLSPEGSRKLQVWAWIAAATHSRASLKQRIKEVLPRASIGKI